jgi:LmbE family N-acetylglucosaminyl deacetylase
MTQNATWEGPKKILAIFAHPDDPEFFCGATLARWAREGHTVVYHLLTKGDKGTNDPAVTPAMLAAVREKEQVAAAQVIGASDVQFSNFGDGCLLPDMDLRREITRVIRKVRPDVLVTSDPTNFFPDKGYVNHPDHRYAGQATLDAAFPGAFIRLYFPELSDEGLEPHSVGELWLALTHQPDVTVDVTDTWDVKVRALLEHRSQIGDPEAFQAEAWKWKTEESTVDSPRFEEKFRRFIFE